MQYRARGASLVELLAVVAIVGLLIALALPNLAEARRGRRALSGSSEMRALLRRLRSDAIRSGEVRGVRFRKRPAGWTWSVHRDGNGNGLRSTEIDSGVDPLLDGPFVFRERFAGSDLRIPDRPDIPAVPPDSGPLPNRDDPVQFGSSDIVSFTPKGTCSPGTLYVSSGENTLCAVRAHGSAGRIRRFQYFPASRRWVQR